jgi:rubrerythrin
MSTEQEKTLEGLQTAIRMEIDGKEFYLKAGQESGNEAGRKLLNQLAAEEDIHRQVFEGIYESIRAKKDWPSTDFHADHGAGLRNLFAQALEQLGSSHQPAATELEAVKTAMDMESRSYDFYIAQGKDTGYRAARDFFNALAAQERQHQLVLLDYYEYLRDPAGYFVSKEHPTLDGG